MSDRASHKGVPRGVAFDATGTLIEATEPVGEVYRRVALQFDVDLPAWRLEDGFRRVLRHAPVRGISGATCEARCQSEVDWWFEIIRQTFQATDSTIRFADFIGFATTLFETYRSAGAWRVRAGIREVLDALHASKVPLAVVSNFDHRLADILKVLELEHYFELSVTTAMTGYAKPERIPFEAAAEALACPLRELVYVGDDASERLERIADYGIRVIDIRDLENPRELTDQILSGR